MRKIEGPNSDACKAVEKTYQCSYHSAEKLKSHPSAILVKALHALLYGTTAFITLSGLELEGTSKLHDVIIAQHRPHEAACDGVMVFIVVE